MLHEALALSQWPAAAESRRRQTGHAPRPRTIRTSLPQHLQHCWLLSWRQEMSMTTMKTPMHQTPVVRPFPASFAAWQRLCSSSSCSSASCQQQQHRHLLVPQFVHCHPLMLPAPPRLLPRCYRRRCRRRRRRRHLEDRGSLRVRLFPTRPPPPTLRPDPLVGRCCCCRQLALSSSQWAWRGWW